MTAAPRPSPSVWAWAGIGALIGSVVVGSLCAVSFLPDPIRARFFTQALLMLVPGGAVGGAICGTAGWLVTKARGCALVAAAVGGFCGFVCALLASFIYAGSPWPGPSVYPGSAPAVAIGASGSWGQARISTYTVDVALSEVQSHYEAQMAQHCVSKWRFQPQQACDGSRPCVEASCEVPRWWMDQGFDVRLFALSDDRTEVIHRDFWED